MSTFLHRLFTSILSILVFSSIITAFQVYVLNNELPFVLLLTIYMFYTTPVFILGGITASYIVDFFLKKQSKEFFTKMHRYVHTTVMYGIAGIVVAMVYSSMTSISKGEYFSTFSQSIMTILVGILGAIVFYNIHMLLEVNWDKFLKAQHEEEEIENVKQFY